MLFLAGLCAAMATICWFAACTVLGAMLSGEDDEVKPQDHTIVYPTSPYSTGEPYCEECDYFELEHTVYINSDGDGICSNDPN